MKTILHINSYYSNSGFYTDFYNALNPNKYHNIIYVPVQKKFRRKKYDTYAELILSQTFNKFDRLFFLPKIIKTIKDAESKIDFLKVDLIHSHSLFANGLVAYYISKKYKIPMVSAFRNTDFNVFIKKIPFFKLIAFKLINYSSKIIFISPSYHKKLLRTFKNPSKKAVINSKSMVIPNGINKFWLEEQQEKSSKSISSEKKVKLLQVGDINKNKNIINSLKAINYLNNQFCDRYQISFIGKILSKRIKNLIHKNPYATHIDFLPKEKLKSEYNNHDIFMLPSINETFGIVYIESLSQGIPVIYSKDQGVDGFFDHVKVGEKVNPNSAISIAKAIIKISSSYNLYQWPNKTLLENFNWNNIAKKYESMYGEILNDSILCWLN